MSNDKRQILNNAHKLLDRGLYDRAIREYMRIVELDPSDVFALQKIAELHTRNGAHASAVSFYEKSYSVLKKKGFHEKCVAVLKRILELDPGQMEYRHALALSQGELGRLEEAANTLRSLIGLYEKKGDRQQSLRMLKELVRLLPKDWTNRARLAEAYASLGKNILAVEAFKEVIAQLNAANNFVEHDRVAERVLYLYPDQHDVGLSLCRSYLSQRKIREALIWLQVLFKSNPKDPETLELLGDAFLSQDRGDKALAVYKEARRVLHQEGRTSEAEVIREKIFRVDPDQSLSMAAPVRPISITSQKPAAVDAELPPAVLLSDALILLKFELPTYGLARLNMLPDEFRPGKANAEKIRSLQNAVSGNEQGELTERIAALAALLETEQPQQSQTPSAETPAVELLKREENKKVAVNLEDEIDLDGLDFSDFDDDSSLLTESVLDRIDTRELREDAFDFEIEGESVREDADEFADLLDGHDSSLSDSPDIVITPPVAPSALETKEKFPRIRPLIDAEVKSKLDTDRTQEVTALMDDFTAETSLDAQDITFDVKEGEPLSTSTRKQVTVNDDDEFGGLLESED